MILVTGAAGLNGSHVVARLAFAGHKVRALVRRPGTYSFSALQGVETVIGDMLKPETLATALDGVDHAMLISSSAPDMVEVQNTFIDAAKKAGVKHIVKLSGIIPDLDSPFRFARMHGLIEKHLEESGVAFTHLRAGEFMHSYFRAVPLIVRQGMFFLAMEDARIASVDVDDIADVAVECLTKPGHEGKIYRLTGPEANTMAEIAQKISAAIGKPVQYVPVSPEKSMQGRLGAGMLPYLAEALDELFAERRKGKESTVYKDIETVLGRPAKSFDAFAAEHAAVFSGEQAPPTAH